MDKFHLKYYPHVHATYKQDQINTLLNQWIINLSEESTILSNILESKYKNHISQALLSIINQIISLCKTHMTFLKGYLHLLESFEIDSEEQLQRAMICYLRETYNKILLIIQKVYCLQRQLVYLREGQTLKIPNKTIIDIPFEILQKIREDIEKIQKEQKDKEKNFDFVNNKVYPEDKQMEGLFNEFVEKTKLENEKILTRVKYCKNQNVKKKLLAKQVKLDIKTTYRYTSS
jgi:hypothetical protein